MGHPSPRSERTASGGSGGELLRTSTHRRSVHKLDPMMQEQVAGMARRTASIESGSPQQQDLELEKHWKLEKYKEAFEAFKNEEERQKRWRQKQKSWCPSNEDWARSVYLVASGDGQSHAALIVRVASSATIALSAVMCCLASVEDSGGVRYEERALWESIEGFCLAFFSVEYIVRFTTARSRPPDDERERRRELEEAHARHHNEASSAVAKELGQHEPDAANRARDVKEQPRVQQQQTLWSFAIQPFNIIDLFAVLPFLAEKMLGWMDLNLQIVRVLRILRVIRVLKLGRVSGSLALFARGLRRSQDYIITLLITLVIIMILFASLIFAFETETVLGGDAIDFLEVTADRAKPARQSDASVPGSPAIHVPSEATSVDECFTIEEEERELRFANVPDVFWFVVSEITTVGNSSKHPVGVIGQTLAVILMCVGVFYLGFAQAVVVDGFKQVLREHARTSNGGKNLKRIFNALDQDSDKLVKVEDIYNGVRRFDPALASAWEPYLGLDIGNQERQTGARKEFGSISFEFFQNLMEESNSARGQDSIGSVVDLDAVATELALVKEDQEMLMDEVNYLHIDQQHILKEMEEQTRLLTLLAQKAGIDTEMAETDCRYPLPEGKKYHFFISHSQATGGDQANLLCTNLKKEGLKVWYDMEMSNITKQGMEKGVRESQAFIILLTAGMMDRPFCQYEMRCAISCERPPVIVGVSEQDPRRGPVSFDVERESAPIDLRHLIDNTEFLPFRRRAFEAKAMYEEIIKRGLSQADDGVAEAASESKLARLKRDVVSDAAQKGARKSGTGQWELSKLDSVVWNASTQPQPEPEPQLQLQPESEPGIDDC